MKRLILLAIPWLLVACQAAAEAPVSACDAAQLVDHIILDAPVEQGTTVMPGTHFTKAWQVLNEGTCDWSADYSLVQVSGPDLGAEPATPLAGAVASGEETTLAVRLTAPSQPGDYTVEWMLRNAAGEQFGTGPQGDRPLSLEFSVAALPAGVRYDFTQAVCLARWDSDRATFLPCEGSDDEAGLQDGYVRVNTDPALEGQTRNNPPVIEVKPNNQSGGWISGIFPPITIAAGDRFSATIGCMDQMPRCAVAYWLQALLPDGSVETIEEWYEEADDVSHEVSADLSAYAGREVSLVLVVLENGGRSLEARAFWLNPVIHSAQ